MTTTTTTEVAASAETLGFTPSPEEINKWFVQVHGLYPQILGKSIEGRELVAYSLQNSTSSFNNGPTFLFISLVHGNEPFGLVTLLHTAEALLERYNKKQQHQGQQQLLNLIFFPVVNIDTYVANRYYGNGCRRTNMRKTCDEMKKTTSTTTYPCPLPTLDGIDLNRNFDYSGRRPTIRTTAESICDFTYEGINAFSEPETQAIHDLVIAIPNLVTTMGFHTRRSNVGEPIFVNIVRSSC